MNKNNLELDLFAFAARQAGGNAVQDAPAGVSPLNRQQMTQAALAFLATRRCDGIAPDVPARFRKYQVAVAAFWTREVNRVRQPAQTAIVDIYTDRNRCFSDCAGRDKLLAEISAMRRRRLELEEAIRLAEPQLCDSDDLFAEMPTWHYERSENMEYRRLRRKLERMLRILHKGSRLERIRRAGVADLLYLAVPPDTILPDECAAGWGLLYINHDGSVREIRPPEPQACTPATRLHLALNIGHAAACHVLFAAGVSVTASGETKFYRPPRRRLKRTMQ